MPRHGTESLIKNEEELYEEFFEERGVNHITHYRTPRWPPLTAEVRSQLVSVEHIWTLGDRYWKLAHRVYGNPKLWWVIAWYNEKPTEAHLSAGSVVLIPRPIDKVLSYFGYGSM
jgi:nucleoid-associated protein YgaU